MHDFLNFFWHLPVVQAVTQVSVLNRVEPCNVRLDGKAHDNPRNAARFREILSVIL